VPRVDPVVVVPGDLSGPSGGTTYDLRLAREWGSEPVRVPGPWPHPRPEDIALLDDTLARLSTRGPVLVDGIIGSAAPSVLRQTRTRSAPVWLLVHLPLPAETGLDPSDLARMAHLERAALDAALGAVVPSPWAADDLVRRYGPRRVVVAEPGTDPAEDAHGSTPPCLLTPAAFTPRKHHALILDALEQVRDLPWTARWMGHSGPSGTKSLLREALVARGLTDRVSLEEPLTGKQLEHAWRTSDLLLLPSVTETYGMVVAEALAHGIPAVVSAGTAAQQTLDGGTSPVRAVDRAGAALDPGSPDAWARCLRVWLQDQQRRAQWQGAARRRASTLPTWADTAAQLLTALTEAR
jgi:glycosyltransferase involved in cell wall biosynthesis